MDKDLTKMKTTELSFQKPNGCPEGKDLPNRQTYSTNTTRKCERSDEKGFTKIRKSENTAYLQKIYY